MSRQLRVVKPGTTGATRIHNNVVRGAVSESTPVTWEPGELLVLSDGRASPIGSAVDATTGLPKYVALASYENDGSFVAVQEIGPDTVFEAEVASGTPSQSDIGKTGVLAKGDDGNWYVTITSTDPALVIEDVAVNFQPGLRASNGADKVVWFTFKEFEATEQQPQQPQGS